MKNWNLKLNLNIMKLFFWFLGIIFIFSYIKFGIIMMLDIGDTGLFLRVIDVMWKEVSIVKGYVYFIIFIILYIFWILKKENSVRKTFLVLTKSFVNFIKFILLAFLALIIGISFFSGSIVFGHIHPLILVFLFSFSFFIILEEFIQNITKKM